MTTLTNITGQESLATTRPFVFDGTEVRVIDHNGAPWFVTSDVCRVLEIANSRNVTARLDEDEKGVCTMDTLGGAQQIATVSESGLYSLVLTSRKPEAKRFKKWVTSEVLPTIRRTGSYGQTPLISPASMSRLELIKLAMLAEEEKLALESQVIEMAPKVEAYERIAVADGSLCITDAAKALQMRPKSLFDWLRQNGWIYRRAGSGHDVGYQSKTASGLLEHKVTTVLRADGSEKVTEQVRVTSRGLSKLAALIQPALHEVA